MRKQYACIIFALFCSLAFPALSFAQSNKSILFFSTEWCGENCQQGANVISEVRAKAPGTSLRLIDADTNSALVNQYRVTSLPVVIVQENGKTIGRFVGMVSQTALEKLIVPPEEEKPASETTPAPEIQENNTSTSSEKQPVSGWQVPAMQKIN